MSEWPDKWGQSCPDSGDRVTIGYDNQTGEMPPMAKMVDAKRFRKHLEDRRRSYAFDCLPTEAFDELLINLDYFAVEVPDTPKEEWVCGTCHGVVTGEFCHKCHPAETKKLSLTLEYLRVCRVLGELRAWLNATLASARNIDHASGYPEKTLYWQGGRIDGLLGALVKVNELQAKKEACDEPK